MSGSSFFFLYSDVLQRKDPRSEGLERDGQVRSLPVRLDHGRMVRDVQGAQPGLSPVFPREEELCARYGEALKCDVLKAGHHGSAGSTGEVLLENARPSFVVLSCGRNNRFGHPSDRVIELLENSGIIYARTDESGAVYLKRAVGGLLVFENAAKDRQWLIQKTNQIQNTLQRP